MWKSKAKRTARRLSRPAILLAALALVSLSAGSYYAAGAAQRERLTASQPAPRPQDIKAQAKQAAFEAATRTATTGFAPSLEMKENADFVLTPVLLMQEAIRTDIVITYPSE